MFSLLNINKPLGLTSHDVVARVRRVFGLKKVGHLGTLDPLAEGVLPVCLGHATRLIEYFPTDKRYTAKVTLGKTTTTLDAEGEVLSETSCRSLELSPGRLEAVLAAFRGTIQQQVPLYSAVHVQGKKLYELARQGKTAELPSREVTIHALNLLGISGVGEDYPVLELDIHCSSGTYIRSLARDIGEALGCGAYMSGLVRTMHGRLELKDAVPLEILMESDTPAQYLQDPVPYLELPRLELRDETLVRLLSNGMKVELSNGNTGLYPSDAAVLERLEAGTSYMVLSNGKLVGVVELTPPLLKPVKIFHL